MIWWLDFRSCEGKERRMGAGSSVDRREADWMTARAAVRTLWVEEKCATRRGKHRKFSLVEIRQKEDAWRLTKKGNYNVLAHLSSRVPVFKVW